MRLRLYFSLLCLLGAAPALAAENARVLTTIKPLQQIAAAVMDGVDTPALLMEPGASPHTYALRPSDRRALAGAERIYWVGPELELFLQDLLERQDNSVALLHLPQMTVREQMQSHNFQNEKPADHHGHDTHGHHHDHGSLDPHIWLSPANASAIARYMAEDLASVYPQQADQLQANLDLFEQRLTAMDNNLRARLSTLQKKPYFVFHDGYGYFEDHYGMRPQGIFSLSHEVQPGARHINQLRQQLQAAGPSCVFTEPQFTPRLINSLTEGLPISVGTLDPLGSAIDVGPQGYERTLEDIAGALAGCLETL
ncbi:zinc ABC transporter substrate-binding protein ZnuA [uncultured Halopseudomonas sp.]|uniref:zinc ABC transporter substrate-binding protein ZnuA n=1 Tax=uncultured Halopseudomonas sp. TaxID=2901193 RepID=UPI0030EDE018|tara:strand:+ start:38748 stop:39680 length:933 start_codon:yes stop_codon:yes gene_type:complete